VLPWKSLGVLVGAMVVGCHRSPVRDDGAGLVAVQRPSSASVVLGSAAPSFLPPAGDAADPASRDAARLVLERHCGACHIGASPTALPRALAVFDLSATEWAATLSDAQRTELVRRLDQPIPPDGRENDVSDEERAQVRRYVEARRGRGP
jgi:mono/diheme cytochrome c family protein